jgi:hypothetical protein
MLEFPDFIAATQVEREKVRRNESRAAKKRKFENMYYNQLIG